MVVLTKESAAMVVFYNNVKGWINKRRIGDGKVNDVDVRQYFFKGQVVSAFVFIYRSSYIINTQTHARAYV